MARFCKNKRICPFCGSPESMHEAHPGSGGWAVHYRCKVCGAMGPRVPYRAANGWMGAQRGSFDEAIKARELFYGIPEPTLSGRIPPME